MTDNRISFALLLALLVLLRYYVRKKDSARTARLPPGPTPLPLLGNILDIPTTQLGSRFRSISDRYGDIVYLSALGKPMILLGSYEAASELLDNRSTTTSDRQGLVMADLVGFSDWEFTLFGHTLEWRRYRRQFHQLFHKGVVADYQPAQLEHARKLVRRLIQDPDHFISHLRHYFGASIMQIVYGLEIAEENDQYMTIAEKCVEIFTDITVPGRYIVEAFPFLQYLPSWLPGAKFKRDAVKWKESVDDLRYVPYRAAKRDINSGNFSPSIVSRILEQAQTSGEGNSPEVEELCQNISALAYLTGADTTFSSVQAFFLALTQHPHIQRKAQAELDAVVGPHRLPDFSDRPSLPYVNAIVKECFRWLIVTPIGFPHQASEDEEIRGYLIPKGSTLVANVWAMSRDPAVYPDPEVFMPERFLDPRARDPMKFTFGFGRRICPGRHFADQACFIIVALVLHTLNIGPPLDENGNPIKQEARYTTDMVTSYPEPFECRITPRPGRAELITPERE